MSPYMHVLSKPKRWMLGIPSTTMLAALASLHTNVWPEREAVFSSLFSVSAFDWLVPMIPGNTINTEIR